MEPPVGIIAAISSDSALLGATIATLTQIFTGRSVRRSQRDLLDPQSDLASRQVLQTERRRVYAEYLAVADQLTTRLARARAGEDFSYKEAIDSWLAVSAALESTRLLGPGAVTLRATALTSHLSDDADAAVRGEPAPRRFGDLDRPLVAEMQKALGIPTDDTPKPPAVLG